MVDWTRWVTVWVCAVRCLPQGHRYRARALLRAHKTANGVVRRRVPRRAPHASPGGAGKPSGTYYKYAKTNRIWHWS